jgi:amino acid permease
MAIVTAAPLCVLPAKDSIEEIWFKKDGLNKKNNVLVTLFVITVCFLLSLVIPGIGYAITLSGCTTSPAIGFFIPILFYFKTHPEESRGSPKKIICMIIFAVILVASVLGFYNFIVSLVAFHKKN